MLTFDISQVKALHMNLKNVLQYFTDLHFKALFLLLHSVTVTLFSNLKPADADQVNLPII
jgi:hypothetical protein